MFDCTGCGVSRPVVEYRVRRNGYRIPKCRVCEREYMRARYAKNPHQIKERKRESMARWRGANPEIARQRSRESHHRRRDQVAITMREMNATRIFWSRAQKLRGITARQLASIWKAQRGLCALTGRKMDRAAQIDHIDPKARGGTDALSNLQWVTAEANLAKRNLTDAEFHALCSDVVRWIGERIQAVEMTAEAKAEAA